MGEPANAESTQVPVAWEALEDAFENNAPEVHSYLNVRTGDVTRVVDGVADPSMHQRIAADPEYLRVDPVSSREQYRWMERYIATVEDGEFRDRLAAAIDGKGAFRRFKDVLIAYPVDRERWFTFRSERLRTAMETWLAAHGLVPVERQAWQVPTASDIHPAVGGRDEAARAPRRGRAAAADATRKRLHELVELLPNLQLEMAAEFLEFLRERRPTPRAGAKVESPRAGAKVESAKTEAPAESETEGAAETEGAPARKRGDGVQLEHSADHGVEQGA